MVGVKSYGHIMDNKLQSSDKEDPTCMEGYSLKVIGYIPLRTVYGCLWLYFTVIRYTMTYVNIWETDVKRP